MGNGTCEIADFHQIVNSYPNLGQGTEEQKILAHEEMFDVMVNKYPPLTINVHTGVGYIFEGHPQFSGIELMSRMEYDKIKTIGGVTLSRDTFSKSRDLVHPTRENRFPTYTFPGIRRAFPFIALEHYLLSEARGEEPNQKELEFAQKVISDIVKVYENH